MWAEVVYPFQLFNKQELCSTGWWLASGVGVGGWACFVLKASVLKFWVLKFWNSRQDGWYKEVFQGVFSFT